MNAFEHKAQIAKYSALVAGDSCFEGMATKFLHKRAWSPEHAGLVSLFELVSACGGIDENRARHYLLAAGFVRVPSQGTDGDDDERERWQHQPWYLLAWPAPESPAPARATRRGAAAAVGVGTTAGVGS